MTFTLQTNDPIVKYRLMFPRAENRSIFLLQKPFINQTISEFYSRYVCRK